MIRIPRKHAVRLLMLTSFYSAAALAGAPSDPIYASINDETSITRSALQQHASSNPYLMPYMGIPGGPMKILDDMIKMRVLQLEGKRIGHPDHGEMAGGATGFAISLKQRLAPRCEDGSEEEVRRYFLSNQQAFSTPLFLRLNRYGKRTTPETREAVEKHLAEVVEQLRAGKTNFATLAPNSDDDVSKAKGGDIGFVADNDPLNPVMTRLRQTAVGNVVDPLQQGNMAFIYQVTAKREPVTAKFDEIKAEVVTAQRDACSKERTDKLFSELYERWKVKVLVKDISVKPGED